MKGLKKIALASTIAAISAGAQAELKALDDSAMGELTGQAGLTIDLETKYTIGEFAYVDAGVVVLKDISMGGNSNDFRGNDYLDNIRLEIDIAGAGAADASGKPDNYLAYGFSNVKDLAAVHVGAKNADADLLRMAKGSLGLAAHPAYTGNSVNAKDSLQVDDEQVYGDGDLKIHFTFTDAWQAGGGFAAYANGVGKGIGGATDGSLTNIDFATAYDIATQAVDFEFNIGQIALADSTYATDPARLGTETIQKSSLTIDASGNEIITVAGLDTDTGTDTTTTLISNLSFKGYLGPADIHIENNGNGFGNGAGRGDADSKIHWDSFFKVTDLDLYIDIAGVFLQDIVIANSRGDLSSLNTTVLKDEATGAPILDASGNEQYTNTSAFGFAHSKRDIYAVHNAVLDVAHSADYFTDGIAINTAFKGDIDIGAIKFGDDTRSIGSIYLTDVESYTNWTISAH